MIGQSFGRLGWDIAVYTVLSLTVVRIAPVWLALAGAGLTADGKLFLGWFGPRGLASIVFAVIVLDASLPESETLAATVAWTVFLSIVAHGLTASPLADAFARRMGTLNAPVPSVANPGSVLGISSGRGLIRANIA